MDVLLDKICHGDRRSLARAMSLVDQTSEQAETLKDLLRQSTAQMSWWGFTGPPGVGKSTLIDSLLGKLRERDKKVGVVAVDPTSPVSEGALLGDRVRMMRHALDPEVFIRSLATHRREGGLSDATLHCARLLELAGFDPVLIETVGVGQNEVDIASVADICVVIPGPGYGDEIQLIKAGLLEIADIVVVNKCDLPEANRLLQEVRQELTQSSSADAGQNDPPNTGEMQQSLESEPDGSLDIVGIEAKSGEGVDLLLEKLLKLNQVARDTEQQVRNRDRRVLGEIKRSAMLTCQVALEQELSTAETGKLVTKLQQGKLTLDAVVKQLGAKVLSVLQGQSNK